MHLLRCLLIFVCFTPGLVQAADEVAVPLERVHICCDDCQEGVRQAVTSAGATRMLADQETSRVVIFAPDTATAQKAVKAMVAAGYYGRSRNAAVPVTAETDARDAKVKSTEITGVHLCCSSCVEQAKAAILAVPGVTTVVATTNATSMQVQGEYNEKAALDALLDVGFSGKVVEKK